MKHTSVYALVVFSVLLMTGCMHTDQNEIEEPGLLPVMYVSEADHQNYIINSVDTIAVARNVSSSSVEIYPLHAFLQAPPVVQTPGVQSPVFPPVKAVATRDPSVDVFPLWESVGQGDTYPVPEAALVNLHEPAASPAARVRYVEERLVPMPGEEQEKLVRLNSPPVVSEVFQDDKGLKSMIVTGKDGMQRQLFYSGNRGDLDSIQ